MAETKRKLINRRRFLKNASVAAALMANISEAESQLEEPSSVGGRYFGLRTFGEIYG